MTTINKDTFAGGAGFTESDDIPIAKTFQDVADDLTSVVARGDATMQGKVDALATQLTAVRTKVDSFIGHFNNHRGAAGVHVAADVDNPIGSPVATDVTADILTLLNDSAAMYMDHYQNVTGSIHGAATDPNAITATMPATDETEAVALGADLYTQYEAHRVNVTDSVHANPDSTNTIASASPSDWDSLITFCNEIKNTTGFNDHIALTAGPVHGADGSADAITAADSGVQKTALELEVNEFKTDLNAHVVHLGVHPNAGTVNATTAATTEATSVALINGLKATANTHFASADDHLDADTEVVAGTATEYEDIIAVVAEWKAAYVAHAAKSAVHDKADAGNAETAITASGDVATLGTGGAVTLKTIKGTV